MSAATWSVSGMYCILGCKFSSFECIRLGGMCLELVGRRHVPQQGSGQYLLGPLKHKT